MHYRAFGKTGLFVSSLVLGTGRIGDAKDGSFDAGVAESIVRDYLDAGGNVIDTAEAYHGGGSEELLGRILGKRRDEILLISKCSRSTDANAGPGRIGNHRKAVVQAVESSLRRLRTDRIDVYMAHLDDGSTPIEELMGTLTDLVRAGKILYPGLSNFPAWKTARAASLPSLAPLAAVEIEYSLLSRDVEREILPCARELGLSVLAYSPLAGGRLSRDLQSLDLPLREAIQEVANGRSPLAVSLAWLVARGVLPILGARTVEQLRSNLAEADLVLSPEHVARLEQTLPRALGYPHDLLEKAAPRWTGSTLKALG